MLYLRSILFNALFYITTLGQMIIFAPWYFAVSRSRAWWVPRTWAKVNNWLLRVICGAHLEVRGLENIPKGPCIIAAKHQSAWDTFVMLPYVGDPVLILKRELMWIPFFGQYVGKMKMIAIKRSSREEARRQVAEGAARAKRDGRQILIYPEGTRRSPGAEPAYKQGVAMIYSVSDMAVLPVAHNAGLYWPRRKFLRFPGKMIVEFLPPIEAGLPRDAFLARLVSETEEACDRLLVEAAQSDQPPPMPETAKKRLAELGHDLKG